MHGAVVLIRTGRVDEYRAEVSVRGTADQIACSSLRENFRCTEIRQPEPPAMRSLPMTTHGRNTIATLLIGALLVAAQNESASGAPRAPGQYEPHRRLGDNPPITLPASGLPGEEIRFNRQRSEGSESWAYRWQVGEEGGGSWILVGYTFNHLNEQER